MAHSHEFWIIYHQASRAAKPSTAQLIELEHAAGHLHDLEDVLDHVFAQGFLEPKFRTMTWWETLDGTRMPASRDVQDIIASGAGHCPEHALKLVIADVPSTLWVRYVYTHSARAHTATQRIKLDTLHHSICHDRLAHITNYVFAQGYLPAHVRPCVYWEAPCGRRLGEVAHVEELLGAGEGCSEAKALRLVIDV